MVTLQRNQIIEVYQISMEIQTKTKENPFIAVLILASENPNNEITPKDIQEKLFGGTLPERACKNLLMRLTEMNYFQENIASETYTLTNKGIENAKDKTFWQGEKGIYNVYLINESLLFSQELVKMEKKERSNNDKDNTTIKTPNKVSNLKEENFNLLGREFRVENIDNQCFKLKDETWNLRVIAQKYQKTKIQLLGKNQEKYFEKDGGSNDFFDYGNVLERVLIHFGFDGENIKVPFDENNLTFIRNVPIEKPEFKKIIFDKTTIENINHIPEDEAQANKWYEALLIKNILEYFTSQQQFDAFSEQERKKFMPYYPLQKLNKNEVLAFLKEEKYFYQRAKLETIDFLSY